MSRSVSERIVRAVAALSLVSGCGATVTSTPDGSVAADLPPSDAPRPDVPVVDVPRPGRVPLRHRASAMTCPSTRPAATCDPGGGGPPVECRVDGDCATGVNGRCVGNPRNGCQCSYDRCTTDGECTTGGPCECRIGSLGGGGANVCIAGNCRVDADCGAGGYCSPTLGFCGDFGGLAGYYCHTPQDACIDDADCQTVLDGGFLGQRPYCMFTREVGRWTCSNSGCAG